MAFDLNSIGEYVNQNAEKLIAKSLLTPRTLSFVTIQEGIKYKDKVYNINTEVELGDGSTCTPTAAGKTSVLDKDITVAPIRVYNTWCQKDLMKTVLGKSLNTRAGAENLPLEEAFIEDLVVKHREAYDKAVWVSDKTSEVASLKHFDGFLTLMDASTEVIKPTNTKAINLTNIEAIMDLAIDNVPADVLDKVAIFVGTDTFRVYQQYLTKKNLFHYKPEEIEGMSVTIPGTAIMVHGMKALNGTKAVIACNPKNLVVGMDMANDEEVYDFWYSKDNGDFRLKIEYKLGAQIAFEDEVVLVKGA